MLFLEETEKRAKDFRQKTPNQYSIMPKRTTLFFLISVICLSLYVYFKLFWIEVKYQRTTGPEFVVTDSANKLQTKFGVYRNVNYTMLYTDVETDDQNEFLSFENYYLSGSFGGFEKEYAKSKTSFLKLKECMIVPKFLIQAGFAIALAVAVISVTLLLPKKKNSINKST